jgi:hypothetical protein
MASPTLHFENERGGTRNQAGQRRQVRAARCTGPNQPRQGKHPREKPCHGQANCSGE